MVLPASRSAEIFGVGCGVGISDKPIASTANDFAISHDDGANGNFAESGCSLALTQSFFHPGSSAG